MNGRSLSPLPAASSTPRRHRCPAPRRIRQANWVQAVTALEESLARFRNVGHLYGMGWTLCHLGDVALVSGDGERAVGWFEEALRLYRHQGIPDSVSTVLFGLGQAMHHLNDDARAVDIGSTVELLS